MRASAVLLVGCLLIPACGPSEGEIKKEFEAFVAERNQCAADSDCVIVSPGCPLGCNVAVRGSEAEAVKNKAEELIHDYEGDGESCAYSCMPASAVCAKSRCEAVTDTGG